MSNKSFKIGDDFGPIGILFGPNVWVFLVELGLFWCLGSVQKVFSSTLTFNFGLSLGRFWPFEV